MLVDALREQGETPAECLDLLPALQRLPRWEAPQPQPEDTRHLIARLALEIPALSSIRQAIRNQRRDRNSFLLSTARAQVSLLGYGFWMVSALITAVGAAVVLSKVIPDQTLVLKAGGPLLAYMATIVAFRGRGRRVLELELTCLPSPLLLALARLVIVLGYDVALGIALSLVLWARGSDQVLLLTLSWLMPLLLVAGLALLLSLRFSVEAAASLAYVGWLGYLAISTTSGLWALLSASELSTLGLAGMAMLSIALLRVHGDMHRLMPQR